MKLKLLSLLMVLAMLVTCFAACKDDKKQNGDKDAVSTGTEESGKNENPSEDASAEDSNGEVSSENNKEESEFNKLSDVEKLFYFATPELDEDELLNKVCTALNVKKEELFIPTISAGNVFEAGVNMDINEMNIDGEDALESMGGPLGMEASFITDGSAANLNAGMSMQGMSISLVDAKFAGLAGSITSPILLKKPIYLDLNALIESLAAESDFSDINELFGELQTVLAVLEDVGVLATTIGTKTIELIPEDSVTSAKESIEGKYTGKVEAECVTLTLDNEDMASMIKGLHAAFYGDEAFKETAMSALEGIGSLLEYFKEMGEDVPSFEAAEVYETIFEYVEQAGEEIVDAEPVEIVIKRFFVGGKDARFDINVTAEGETLEISAMDITVGDACDFAVSASIADVDMLDLNGGYKGEKSSFNLAITNPDGDYEMNDAGEYVSAPELVYSYSMEKDGDNVRSVTKAPNQESVFELNGDEFVAEGNVDGEMITMEGTMTKDGIDMTFDAILSMGDMEMEMLVEIDNEMTDTKYSSKMSMYAEMDMEGSAFVMDADLEAFVDFDSDAEIEEPKQGKNDYVVDGLDDLQNITSVFSEIITNNLVSSEIGRI